MQQIDKSLTLLLLKDTDQPSFLSSPSFPEESILLQHYLSELNIATNYTTVHISFFKVRKSSILLKTIFLHATTYLTSKFGSNQMQLTQLIFNNLDGSLIVIQNIFSKVVLLMNLQQNFLTKCMANDKLTSTTLPTTFIMIFLREHFCLRLTKILLLTITINFHAPWSRLRSHSCPNQQWYGYG